MDNGLWKPEECPGSCAKITTRDPDGQDQFPDDGGVIHQRYCYHERVHEQCVTNEDCDPRPGNDKELPCMLCTCNTHLCNGADQMKLRKIWTANGGENAIHTMTHPKYSKNAIFELF